jgi:hypothetical protein
MLIGLLRCYEVPTLRTRKDLVSLIKDILFNHNALSTYEPRLLLFLKSSIRILLSRYMAGAVRALRHCTDIVKEESWSSIEYFCQ